MSQVLELFSDLSERLNYNLPGLPLYVRKGHLRHFANYTAACHWHPDMEFILILQGTMDYFVNGHTVSLKHGEGLFVNSNRLHYGFSQNKSDCEFLVVVIHPSLLGESSPIIHSYCEEMSRPSKDDLLLLTDKIDWQQQILTALKKLYSDMHDDPSPNPLRLLSSALHLCAGISEHIEEKPGQAEDLQMWANIREMTDFIHKNYERKISLDEIAAAGAMCRSHCCKMFNQYTGQTPNTYLTRYRIQKSCEMLKESNRSILEIAMACGFQSASYFSSIFRKELGMVPQDYRKSMF